MTWMSRLGTTVAAMLIWGQSARGQDPPPDGGDEVTPPASSAGAGLESHSLPGELTEDIYGTPLTRLGPTPVTDVRFLQRLLNLDSWFSGNDLRTFGWAEAGYSGSSSGNGLLSVQPRQNRFGNQFLFNQLGFALQKPLEQDRFNIGFNIRYFAGADAAALPASPGWHRLPGR